MWRRLLPSRATIKVLLLALVMYVASVGPAAWIMFVDPARLSEREWKILETVYWPIEFAMHTCPAVNSAVNWYATLWAETTIPDNR